MFFQHANDDDDARFTSYCFLAKRPFFLENLHSQNAKTLTLH